MTTPLGNDTNLASSDGRQSSDDLFASNALTRETLAFEAPAEDRDEVRELEEYGTIASSDETLVGLGPPSSRDPEPAAPDTLRRPRSEPPGPWGSDVDHEIPASIPRQKGGVWSVAVPLLAGFAGLAVLGIRSLSPSSSHHEPSVAAVQPKDGTGLLVRVDVPGARVSLDGQDRGAPPLLLTGLEPGPHVVRITAPERATLEQPVMLIADHVSTLEPVLPPAVDPNAPPSESTAPSSERTEPQADAVHSDATVPSTARAGVPARAPRYTGGVKPTRIELEESNDAAAVAEKKGLLAASSNPPSSIVVDGRPLGKTPRALELSPGVHTVVFIHPTLGRKSVTAYVLPGKTASAAVEF